MCSPVHPCHSPMCSLHQCNAGKISVPGITLHARLPGSPPKLLVTLPLLEATRYPGNPQVTWRGSTGRHRCGTLLTGFCTSQGVPHQTEHISSFSASKHRVGTLCWGSCFCPEGPERRSECTRTQTADSSRYGNVARALGVAGEYWRSESRRPQCELAGFSVARREAKRVSLGPAGGARGKCQGLRIRFLLPGRFAPGDRREAAAGSSSVCRVPSNQHRTAARNRASVPR